MENNSETYCAYNECRRKIDLNGDYLLDEKMGNYFCHAGCRSMWALEDLSFLLDLREKGIEEVVIKRQTIKL